jgi:hypothetical protein
MFWSEHFLQHTFFDESPVIVASCNLSELVRFAEQTFPNETNDMHRYIAFLTHEATQNFLGPMLKTRFGSIDEAKVRTIAWLEEVGSFETIARLTRSKDSCCNTVNTRARSHPQWYVLYNKTDRCAEMKRSAEVYWREYMSELHCSVNARHSYEVMHHSDYGRIGEADEFRYLVPLCNDCHASVSVRGPRVPSAAPEGVRRWL